MRVVVGGGGGGGMKSQVKAAVGMKRQSECVRGQCLLCLSWVVGCTVLIQAAQ